jgi:alanine dehydrogenase
MIIGVPKEIKTHEYRVGMTPSSVKELIHHGHQVIVETKAGMGAEHLDEAYQAVGATIVPKAEDIFKNANLIVKVKEPQPNECRMMSKDQILFTYLHLAADPVQAELLLASKCTAIAYETVTDGRGGLPLLSPMSEVAGRMSIQAGAAALEKVRGGAGILLGGVPGVPPADVLVIGGGVSGTHAIRMAVGMGARVTVIDTSVARLRELNFEFHNQLTTVYSTQDALEHCVYNSDLVVLAVLIPGAAAPKLIKREMLKKMRRGSVLVDLSIDQGGCAETSRPTTHNDPTFIVDGVVHYCVANMPGGVPRTSAQALNNATLPYIKQLASKGLEALTQDAYLRAGLNIHDGYITHPAVAQALGYICKPFGV